MQSSFVSRHPYTTLLLLLGLVLGGAIGLIGSEYLLRAAVDRAVSASDGKLAVTGVQGSLFGSLKLDHVSYGDEFQRVSARGIEAEWSLPELLLKQRLHLRKLRLQQLDVDILKLDPEPFHPPQSLALPLEINIPAARVEQLDVTFEGKTRELGALDVSLDNLDRTTHVAAGLDGGWGKAHASLDLPSTAPFALAGTLDIDIQPYSARMQVGGELATISLSGNIGDGRHTVELTTKLTPFEQSMLHQATLKAQHLDPHRYGNNLPGADISVNVQLQADANGGYRGMLDADNSQPGSIDKLRLPLRRLATKLQGNLDSMALQDIRLDAAQAGQFNGTGTLNGSKVQLDLATAALDLRGIHGRLKSTRLAGNLHLGIDGALQTLLATLHQQGYRIDIDVQHQQEQLVVHHAKVTSAGSTLALQGTLPLKGRQAFRAEGTLQRFNPADFGDFPEGTINADFAAQGSLSPVFRSRVHVETRNSSYRSHTLAGTGQFEIADDHVDSAELDIRLGANRLQAHGSFGRPNDQIDWRLDAPDLGMLGKQLSGHVSASGQLGGSWTQPSGEFDLSAADINWNGVQHLAGVRANGRLGPDANGALDVTVSANGYRNGEFRLDNVALAIGGRRDNHVIRLAASNEQFDANAELAGGWEKDQGWKGSVQTLENRGEFSLALLKPAQLAVGGDTIQLQDAVLQLTGGIALIQSLTWRDGLISSRGGLAGVNVADMIQLAGKQTEKIGGTLTLGGLWRIEASDRVNGELDIWREQGDLTLPGEFKVNLGLEQIDGHVSVNDNQLTARLDMYGSNLGQVEASGQGRLEHMGNFWGFARDSLFNARVNASMPSLAWAAPLFGLRTETDGAIEVHFNANGKVSEPTLTGVVAAEKLKFSNPGQGISLKEGSLRATLRDSQLRLDQLVFSGKQGTLSANGSVTLSTDKPEMHVDLQADKLQVLDRPDRQLVMSGKGDVTLRDGRIHVTAKLVADSAQIIWGKGDTPELGSDVVVLGRDEGGARKPMKTSLAVDFDLGKQFYFKGEGIDARLEGAVTLTGKGDELPAASGSISVAQGSYFAYGQNLAIDRGILNFSGPMDNPGLNIVAMRKNLPVEAGVTITGTAMQPEVKLTSNPDVADGEKLSWLVLGHGLGNSSGTELNLLQTAANALLSKGSSIPLEGRIARAAGLDEFVLSGDGALETSVLTFGKRLSSRAYLSYEQGLTGISNVAKISYTLSRRVTIKAQAGTESALDLFYDFSFD